MHRVILVHCKLLTTVAILSGGGPVGEACASRASMARRLWSLATMRHANTNHVLSTYRRSSNTCFACSDVTCSSSPFYADSPQLSRSASVPVAVRFWPTVLCKGRADVTACSLTSDVVVVVVCDDLYCDKTVHRS